MLDLNHLEIVLDRLTEDTLNLKKLDGYMKEVEHRLSDVEESLDTLKANLSTIMVHLGIEED